MSTIRDNRVRHRTAGKHRLLHRLAGVTRLHGNSIRPAPHPGLIILERALTLLSGSVDNRELLINSFNRHHADFINACLPHRLRHAQ